MIRTTDDESLAQRKYGSNYLAITPNDMHLDHDRIGQVQRSPKESCYQEITYPSPISNLNLESHV